MGMFDSFYDDGQEWQTKALDRALTVWRIGDSVPVPFDCQIEAIGPGDDFPYAYATIRGGALVEVTDVRDELLPRIPYGGLTARPCIDAPAAVVAAPAMGWQYSYTEKWADDSGVYERVTFSTVDEAIRYYEDNATRLPALNAEAPDDNKIVAYIEKRRTYAPGPWEPITTNHTIGGGER